MANPDNLDVLLELGGAARPIRDVEGRGMARTFYLAAGGTMGERARYVKRPDQTICAVQLALETDGFHPGSGVTCKRARPVTGWRTTAVTSTRWTA